MRKRTRIWMAVLAAAALAGCAHTSSTYRAVHRQALFKAFMQRCEASGGAGAFADCTCQRAQLEKHFDDDQLMAIVQGRASPPDLDAFRAIVRICASQAPVKN